MLKVHHEDDDDDVDDNDVVARKMECHKDEHKDEVVNHMSVQT